MGGFLSAFTLSAQVVRNEMNPVFKTNLEKSYRKVPKAERSHEDFKKAYRYYLKRENDSTIVYCGRYLGQKKRNRELQNMAHLFRAESLVQKQLYSEAEKDLRKVSKSFSLYPIIILNQANIKMLSNDYEEAIAFFEKLKQQVDFHTVGITKSAIDHNLGVCYLYLKDMDKSEQYLMSALKQQEIEKDTINLIGTYGDIANLFYEQYRDSEAIPFFLKAYDLAQTTDNFELKKRTARNMAVVEENRKDFEKSVAYRKEYDRWKDSLNNQQEIWEIAQLEKRHLAETKQREIGILQLENDLREKQQKWILLGAAALLLVLVLIIYFYWQKIRSSAIIAEQRESLDKLNAFKNRLFSIVSHDLRSSVHGLRRSTEQLRNEVPEADVKLKSLVNQQGAIANSTYGMLDNLLNWALLQSNEIYFNPEKISLKRLVPQVVLNYQPLLDQKGMHLDIDVAAATKVMADVDSVKIVLRNVLDNAIKFSPEGSTLKLKSEEEGEVCELRITDQGSGMTPEQLSMVVEQSAQVSKESDGGSGTGLGVRLCASFMLKNNGSFRMESEAGNGTTVILSFEKA